MEKQNEYTVKVLAAVAGRKLDRLEHGIALRKAMHDKIQRGEKPDCYRSKFIRESAIENVRFLAGLATKFDDKHPDDMCSVSDFVDILATTIALLKKKTG